MADMSLTPAMARLKVSTSAARRRRGALGTPAPSSFLGKNFAGAPSTAQVRIRCKAIFMDTVETLGGEEPTYVQEETMNDLFQARVSFRLPLDISGTKFTNITVTGEERSTLIEAESEASVVALEELQYGHLGMCIVDVSRVRCRDLEKACYEILSDAAAMYEQVKLLFIGWEEDMHKSECCYSAPRCEPSQGMSLGVQKTYDMIPNVANKLASINMAYYLKVKDLFARTEEGKAYMEHIRDCVEHFFVEPPLHLVNENRGSLSPEIKLRMKLILWELLVAIGWRWPDLKVFVSEMGLYVCEMSLLPNHVHIGPAPKALTITGSEEESEEEAIESSCTAAIALLEREKSICLVDLNFNYRSHGELYVVDAREAVERFSFIASQVIAEWELMVSDINACKEYCQNLAVDQSLEGADLMFRMQQSSAKAVADLHTSCLTDLQLAKKLVRVDGE